MTTTGWRCPVTKAPVYVVHNCITQKYADLIIEKYKDKTYDGTHQERQQNTEAVMTRKREVRTSGVCFFDDPHLHQHNSNQMIVANHQMGLKWEITSAEQFQFTSYKSTDKGHYMWHIDGGQDHSHARMPIFESPKNLNFTNQPHLAGTVRKISCSIILNDDYEGGELGFRWFEDKEEADIQLIKPKALDCIFFESSLCHTVKPVTKGTRYSIVRWYAGPPLV